MKNKIFDTDKIKNFDDLLNAKYGKIGSKKHNEFEVGSQRFFISEMLKEAQSDRADNKEI